MAHIPIPPERLFLEEGLSLKEGCTICLDAAFDANPDDRNESVSLALVVVDANGDEIFEASNFLILRIEQIASGEISPLTIMRERSCFFEEALDLELGRLIVANAQFELRYEPETPAWDPHVVFRIRTETGFDDETEELWEDCQQFLTRLPSRDR